MGVIPVRFMGAASVAAMCFLLTLGVCCQQASAASASMVNLGSGFTVKVGTGQPPTIRTISLNQVKRVRLSPALAHAGLGGSLPFFTRWSPAAFAAIKANELHNTLAPAVSANVPAALGATSPAPLAKIVGMTDNGIICAYFVTGCQPPDMAVAASPNWTVQFVNESIAVFDSRGVMVLGFPVDAPTFFNIPSPGTCTYNPSGIPFTTDTRAFYDPNDQRFFLAIGAQNGVADSCPFSSRFYVAVSQSSNPTGLWNVYSFNADPLGIGAFGDFTQFGFDAKALYIGMNSFPVTSHGLQVCPIGYCWAQTLIVNKHRMEIGASVPPPTLLYDYTYNGFPLDTVQPVETVATLGQQPSATPLVSSANFFGPTGNGCYPSPCNQIYVFGISNPLSFPPVISAKVVDMKQGWTYPPNGDEPACAGCVATNDSRIDGQPIYSAYGGGTVSFALNTGVRIGILDWPSNLWGELNIRSSGGKLTLASERQAGYIEQVGITNSFADTMLTPSGSLFVVSDVMSPAIYPSWVYRVQRPGDPLGTLRRPVTVQPGLDSYFPMYGVPGAGNLRWGDFEASSYTGFSSNRVWMASQYPNTDYDWGTSLGESQ